jgi:hypothetical protein
MKDLNINFRNKPISRLNEELVIIRGLDKDDVAKIVKIHEKRWEKIELMKTLDATDKRELHALRDEITDLDFQLQDLWKFERNINFHNFFDLPHCTCPKMDNRGRLGSPYKFYAEDCPLHV